MKEEEIAELVDAVEAFFAGAGPPARTVRQVRDRDGNLRLELGGLFLRCAACGMEQPQSRSRQSPEARRAWVAMHLRCANRAGDLR